MGGINKYCVALAACVVICAAQPVNKLPVLKDLDEEILFKVSDKPQPLVLECLTEGAGNQQIKYSWHKNGQPFNWQSHSDVTQRQNEGSLVFNKPKNDDEGLYQCFAESENGVASSRVVKVKRTYLNAPKVDLRKHKTVEGRPFKLDCAIPDSYPKPTIVWKRLTGSDLTQAKPFLARRITPSPEGDLYFTNVTQEDISKTEKYVCLATSPATNKEVLLAEHLLEEIVADKDKNNGELVLQYASPDMVVKAGSVTMIYCMYGGSPMGFPDWFQNDKNVNNKPGDRITRHNRTSGKRLLIKDTYLEDQATYTCTIDNGVGKQQKHIMHLTVVSVPTYSKRPEKQIVVKEGQDVTIPCHVDGVPAPKLSWTFNAKPLQIADRISLNTSGSSQKSAVSDLTIKKVTKSDKGYYGCKAVNEHGDNYSETLLVVA